MTAEQALALATELGHSVRLRAGGKLALEGEKQPETPFLIRVLKLHRDEIVTKLKGVESPPLDRKEFRKRLEAFWEKEGWVPVGGWRDGEKATPTEHY